MAKNEIKKAIIKRAILGFIYGVFIGQTILILESLMMRDGNFYAVSTSLIKLAGTKIGAVIIQYFLTGLLGTTFAATTVIFEMDNWSLIRQTLLHFIITSIVMYIAGFLCGWFPHTVVSTLIWFGVFIIVYVIFWVCFSLYYKNKVKKINEAL
ncbi:MAG: DUF3021 domain-containing protein [Treponema sp.]|nr:DUF3021 domain-containing protein [Treponema sp.]